MQLQALSRIGPHDHKVVSHSQMISAASAPDSFLIEARIIFRRCGIESVARLHEHGLSASLREPKCTQLGAPHCYANHSSEK